MHETLYCDTATLPLRAEARDSAEMVSQLLYGEGMIVLEETEKWLKVSCTHDGYEGWCAKEYEPKSKTAESMRTYIGKIQSLQHQGSTLLLHPGCRIPQKLALEEEIDCAPEKTIAHAATWRKLSILYMGTPYLWGGRSSMGIDCSGLSQVMYAYFGIKLQRDASQQVKQGKELRFDEAKLGDLAFFENSKGRITHVGIVWDNDEILHASGRVRIDKLTQAGIIRKTDGELSHKLTSLRRYH